MSITEVVASAVESYIKPEFPIWRIRYIQCGICRNDDAPADEDAVDPLEDYSMDVNVIEGLFEEKELRGCGIRDEDGVDWRNRYISPEEADFLAKQIKDGGRVCRHWGGGSLYSTTWVIIGAERVA